MAIIESLKKRRTYYNITDTLPVEESQVVALVEEITELTPDAFNMKSSRIVMALGQKHKAFWDMVKEAYEGKIPEEKINGFRNGAGTILYFYDNDVVKGLQEKFPTYAPNFPGWALQASGMVQINVWSGLRDLGVGASLQHYNPVIDQQVREMFQLPESYLLIGQMPFGGIGAEPDPKAKEDISQRVTVTK